MEGVALAEFLLDDAQLLAQVHFALVGGDFILQARVHFVMDSIVAQLAGQDQRQQLQPRLDIGEFQQLLHVIGGQGQDSRQRVAKRAGLAHGQDVLDNAVRQGFVELACSV